MLKKTFLYLVISLISFYSFSQQITNIVMVGPNGITEDPKEATSFAVVKSYPDSHFERLDYKKAGPLIKARTYKDLDLKILDGRYLEYATDGKLALSGWYLNNEKNSDWMTYNDSGKVINFLKYANDSIVAIVDLNKKDSPSISYPDEKEASFPGGLKAWAKYLTKRLEKDNSAEKSFKGGKVTINFVIGMDGMVKELFVSKSVEFVLDEASLKMISESPKWNPAFQNGKNLNAYRVQPLTFMK